MWQKKFSLIAILTQFFFQPVIAQQGIFIPKNHHQLISVKVHQVSNFDAEFCSQARTSDDFSMENRIDVVCFGHMNFQETVPVRAFVLSLASGKKLVYLENDLPGVELLKTTFSVVGPTEPDPQFSPTIGKSQILIGGNGEVTGLLIQLNPFGFISAVSK